MNRFLFNKNATDRSIYSSKILFSNIPYRNEKQQKTERNTFNETADTKPVKIKDKIEIFLVVAQLAGC